MALSITMTLEQMRAATKAQILQNVAAHNTKREIAVALLGQERVADRVVIIRDAENRIVKRVEVERDLLTGNRLGGRVTMRDFYDAGEVNRIIISERDAGNNEIGKRTIKHFRNGRQPVMVEANAVEPVVGDL